MPQTKAIRNVKRLARERYALDSEGIHGPSHWERVCENGLYIARHSEADSTIVQLFSCLHDCCRENEQDDPGHGERAAVFAETLRDQLPLSDEDFEQLHYACTWHTDGRTSGNPTIGACWDADRLDLGRVFFAGPDPRYFSTPVARHPEVMRWALARSRGEDGLPPAYLKEA